MIKIFTFYLDLDYPFEDFRESREYYRLVRDHRLYLPDATLWMRRSSSGRVHGRVSMPQAGAGLTVLESLQYRALLMDDAKRIRADLARFALVGEISAIDRIFSEKRVGGETWTRTAGAWQLIRGE